MAKKEEENYSTMVNNNAILLSFEGWVKYVEGFSRGIGSSKTVESSLVLDCVGEILEYMQQLRKKLSALLTHCESILEQNELLQHENQELRNMLQKQIEVKEETSSKK